MTKKQRQLCVDILNWYAKNKRELPWRKNRTPYRILVSEVMLQQTQVDRVVPKYKEFLKLFPNSKQLADAKTADVITAWKGLGYNRRALYLQKTAQAIWSQYGGRFPDDIDQLKALPGIGDYTARAILSFSFDHPVPVLDTNHRKFYQRTFFGQEIQSDKELLGKAQEVVTQIAKMSCVDLDTSVSVVHHWNQALMDFMSAVVRKHDSSLVQEYIQHYPAVEKPKKKKKKKTVPFEQTDRYIRGRIIDALRDHSRVSTTWAIKEFDTFPSERIVRVVAQLEKDGLIVQKKGSIVLP